MPTPPTLKFTLIGKDMPNMEFLWSNDIDGVLATGPHYSTTDRDDADQVWGIVLIAPNLAGFYAGWSNGEKALSAYEDRLYDTELAAANAAEELARIEATRQCAEA